MALRFQHSWARSAFQENTAGKTGSEDQKCAGLGYGFELRGNHRIAGRVRMHVAAGDVGIGKLIANERRIDID